MCTIAAASGIGFKARSTLDVETLSIFVQYLSGLATFSLATIGAFRITALPLRAQTMAIVCVHKAFVII